MNSSFVNITCLAYNSLSMADFHDHLIKHKKYEVSRMEEHNFVVDFFIDDVNVSLNVTRDFSRSDIDVCWVGGWVGRSLVLPNFIDEVKERTSFCKLFYPTAPIIITCCDAEVKYKPDEVKEAALGGWEIFNQEMGNELANEIGAVKYLEYSWETGRGVKLIIDEIVYAGLGKLKDGKERKTKSKKCKIL